MYVTLRRINVFAAAALLTVEGCRQSSHLSVEQFPASGVWLIPVEHIYDGGPGKDGIPALSNPDFVKPEFATYLADEDLVLGMVLKGEARAYPHPILEWHEVVNDVVGGTSVSITYCPLTGSGITWDRTLAGNKTTFGVSGLLYNSNLIAFDRETGSHWSQMKLQCVNGPLMGRYAQTHRMLETTWNMWKKLYPETLVLSSHTGFARPYGTYPYGDYKESDRLIFPLSNDDRRLPRKERVLGVLVGEKAKVYPIAGFSPGITVVNDTFNNTSLVVVGSMARNFAVAFESTTIQGEELHSFTALENELPVVMVDAGGTKWDIFGRAVEGPRRGEELQSVRSFTAYWFAWGAFYPGVEIHGQ